MTRSTEDEGLRLESPIKDVDGRQLLASELMTRIRNKGFANAHYGRLTQTGDWICMQLVIEAMEATLKVHPARELRAQFMESRAGVTDRFELLALSLLHGMAHAGLELPDALAGSRAALEQLQRRAVATILRRELADQKILENAALIEAYRCEALAQGVVHNVETWECAHPTADQETHAIRESYPKALTRFVAGYLRADLKEGLAATPESSAVYFGPDSGTPCQGVVSAAAAGDRASLSDS